MKKVYALSNSGFVKGSDVVTAIDKVVKLMGLDKEDKTIVNNNTTNIQIVYKTKWSNAND